MKPEETNIPVLMNTKKWDEAPEICLELPI